MTETTYIGYDLWPENDPRGYWTPLNRPGDVIAVTLSDGTTHRYLNAEHHSESTASAAHQYHVGGAGELYIILLSLGYFSANSAARILAPKGASTARVLRTYAPGSWLHVDGEYRARIDDVDPAVNLLDPVQAATS